MSHNIGVSSSIPLFIYQCGRDESDEVDEDKAKEDAQELFDVNMSFYSIKSRSCSFIFPDKSFKKSWSNMLLYCVTRFTTV